MSEKFPKGLKYNKDYSWVKTEEGIATVGVIQKAADQVKEFVFIQLPEEGEKIKKGENYVSLEAMKWSGHLSSPVTGEILEVNQKLFDEPSKINEEPYQSWIMKIKLENDEETKELLNPEEAKKEYEEG